MEDNGLDNASAVGGHGADPAGEPPTFEDAVQAARLPDSRGLRLAKLASVHALVLLLALSGFAAADSWSVITGFGVATVLSILTGALAGVATANLVHEWFHYAGARYAGAAFDIPARPGLFVYDWDFNANSSRQFLTMSIAGSIGGVLAIILLWHAVPADNWGRAALRSGVIASVIFAALVEWPVIRRVRDGGDPLAELAKIPGGLKRNFTITTVAGVLLTLFFAP